MKNTNAGFLGSALLAVTLMACAGGAGKSDTPRTLPTPGPQPSTPGGVRVDPPLPRMPAQITEISVRDSGDSAILDVTASEPLVWTSYRNTGGDFVLELVDAELAPGVSGPAPVGGLIERIEVEVAPMLDTARVGAPSSAKMMTRLTVLTRRDAVHGLRTAGSGIRLTFTPVAAHAGTAPLPGERRPTPPPRAAPAIEADDLEPEVITAAPSPPPAPVATPRPTAPPAAAPPPTAAPSPVAPPSTAPPSTAPAPRATALIAIEATPIAGGLDVRLIGNGTIEPETPFRLDGPPRYVIDLPGLLNEVAQDTLYIDAGGVERVRVGQFSTDPAVTRIVLDLAEAGIDIWVADEGNGLRLVIRR